MARDGVVQEETQQHVPMDVMVATFADRAAAQDAYRTLKTMSKEGLGLDGAIVIDRDEMGKVHLKGAVLPGWVWAIFAIAASVAFGLIGILVLGIVRGVSSIRTRMRTSEYSGTPADQMDEAMRMAME